MCHSTLRASSATACGVASPPPKSGGGNWKSGPKLKSTAAGSACVGSVNRLAAGNNTSGAARRQLRDAGARRAGRTSGHGRVGHALRHAVHSKSDGAAAGAPALPLHAVQLPRCAHNRLPRGAAVSLRRHRSAAACHAPCAGRLRPATGTCPPRLPRGRRRRTARGSRRGSSRRRRYGTRIRVCRSPPARSRPPATSPCPRLAVSANLARGWRGEAIAHQPTRACPVGPRCTTRTSQYHAPVATP